MTIDQQRRAPCGKPAAAPGRRTALLGVVWMLLFTTGAGAATVSVVCQRRLDGIDIEASALLDADTTTAWRVLTDYEHYVAFIPDLRQSRVIARQGNRVTVLQTGDATLWLLRFPLAVTYEITELAPTRLQSRAVAGSFRAMENEYRLTPAGSGVRLDYTGRIATGFELFGPFEQLAVERNVTRQFQALADAIEARHAGRGDRPQLGTGVQREGKRSPGATERMPRVVDGAAAMSASGPPPGSGESPL